MGLGKASEQNMDGGERIGTRLSFCRAHQMLQAMHALVHQPNLYMRHKMLFGQKIMRVSCSEVGSMMARILPTMERALFSETRHARTSGAMLFLPTKECMYMHLHIQIMIMLAMAQCIAVHATRKP